MTTPMTIIRPVDITDLNLVSSTVPENEFPLFSNTEDYLVGESIIRNHRIYEAILDANSNAPYVKRFKNTGAKASELSRVSLARSRDMSVAALPNGDYVVAFIDFSTNLPLLIRFNSAGIQQGTVVTLATVVATHISVVGLVDNQIVVAYRFTSGTNNGISFVRLNAAAVVQQTVNIVTSVTATTSYNSVAVGRLVGGNFVVFYTTNVGAVTAFAQYTAAGAISGTITTVVAANGNYAAVVGLENGNFALAYTNATNQPTRAVYNTGNTAVAAAATVAAVTAIYTDVGSIGTGDFVVTYRDSTNGNSTRFQRYNNAGTAQGAVTVVTAVSSTYSKISGIANNQFVVCYYETANLIPKFARYNATGVLQGTITTIEETPVTSVCVSGLPNGQFVFSVANSNSADPNLFENQDFLWVDTGPTNRFAALDKSGGTMTTAMNTMEYSFSAPSQTALAFLDAEFNTVRVRGFSPSLNSTFYDVTYALPDQANIVDWQSYFDEPILRKRELIITDIPRIADTVLTVTMEGTGSISVGTILFGTYEIINFVQYGAKAGIIDYSKKETNDFGITTLTKRAFAKRADVSVIVNPSEVDLLQRRLAEIRATPVLFVCTPNQFEALTIFGFYREFSIDIALPSLCYCSFELEGII